MEDEAVVDQHIHILLAVCVFDFVKFQDVFPRGKRCVGKFFPRKFRHHKAPPAVRVKGHTIGPAQPVRKVGRDQHEALKQHKEAKQTRDQRHPNDEMRHGMGDQLCQRFGGHQTQEHVQKVPRRVFELKHGDDNERH
mmetsp:Transcript_61540/g.68937  ORF Transcript_61540/g.68937 Transcript_61540/m.68937 type:complete len:137 (+) Transcript_61540:373-783(+)